MTTYVPPSVGAVAASWNTSGSLDSLGSSLPGSFANSSVYPTSLQLPMGSTTWDDAPLKDPASADVITAVSANQAFLASVPSRSGKVEDTGTPLSARVLQSAPFLASPVAVAAKLSARSDVPGRDVTGTAAGAGAGSDAGSDAWPDAEAGAFAGPRHTSARASIGTADDASAASGPATTSLSDDEFHASHVEAAREALHTQASLHLDPPDPDNIDDLLDDDGADDFMPDFDAVDFEAPPSRPPASSAKKGTGRVPPVVGAPTPVLIPFAYTDSKGRAKLTSAGSAALYSLADGPEVVVVIGPPQSGKSTWINRMLRAPGTFPVKHKRATDMVVGDREIRLPHHGSTTPRRRAPSGRRRKRRHMDVLGCVAVNPDTGRHMLVLEASLTASETVLSMLTYLCSNLIVNCHWKKLRSVIGRLSYMTRLAAKLGPSDPFRDVLPDLLCVRPCVCVSLYLSLSLSVCLCETHF